MNREIKFRAWDSVNRKLYLDELESIAFAKSGIPANATISGFSRPLMAIGDDPQLVLMQYTGLEDKNGNEIWEGDVVNWKCDWKCDYLEEAGGNAVVYWAKDSWEVAVDKTGGTGFYGLEGKEFIWDEVEVIGNVMENPELLKWLLKDKNQN